MKKISPTMQDFGEEARNNLGKASLYLTEAREYMEDVRHCLWALSGNPWRLLWHHYFCKRCASRRHIRPTG